MSYPSSLLMIELTQVTLLLFQPPSEMYNSNTITTRLINEASRNASMFYGFMLELLCDLGRQR